MDGTRRNSTALEGLHMTDDLRAFKGIALAFGLSLVFWMLMLWPSHAQQSVQITPEATIKALTGRLNQEVNNSTQYTAAAITLQDKLTASEAEVKRLTEKYEPKKDDPTKP